VTNFATLKSIAWGKLTFDDRVVVHRVVKKKTNPMERFAAMDDPNTGSVALSGVT
jgi:hypothetical protein